MASAEQHTAAAAGVTPRLVSNLSPGDEALQPVAEVPLAKQPLSASGSKSVNLRAFNLYAAKVRQETKEQNPGITGYDVERLIGKKWAKLGEEERKEFTEQARLEREEKIQQGLIKPDSEEKVKKKKRKNEVDLLALALKQQKPEDKGVLLGHMPGLVKPKKRKPGHRVDATIGDGSRAATLIGSPVSGVIDGMFNAGYFVTLQVGEKKQLFKGVIFRPELPGAAGRTDVAPRVWTLDTKGSGRGLGENCVNAAVLEGANGHLGVNGDGVMHGGENRGMLHEGNGHVSEPGEEPVHTNADVERNRNGRGDGECMGIESANGPQAPVGEADVNGGGKENRETSGNSREELAENQGANGPGDGAGGVAGDIGGANKSGEKRESAAGVTEGQCLEIPNSAGNDKGRKNDFEFQSEQVNGENGAVAPGLSNNQGGMDVQPKRDPQDGSGRADVDEAAGVIGQTCTEGG